MSDDAGLHEPRDVVGSVGQDLHRALRSGTYRPRPYSLKVVQDPKTRLIAAPAIVDRIVQNALLTEIGPAYERGFIDQSYACCTGRGPPMVS